MRPARKLESNHVGESRPSATMLTNHHFVEKIGNRLFIKLRSLSTTTP